MIALVLSLIAGTEPPSQVMTNASASIVLERRPTREDRAKAAFTRAERELEAYLAIEVAFDQALLANKASAADEVARRYRAVIEKKHPGYALAAWVRIAEVYLHFAEQIRRKADSKELEAIALGPEGRARDALERGRKHAEKHGVRGVWRDRLDRHLHRLPSR